MITLDEVINGQEGFIRFLNNEEMSSRTLKNYSLAVRHFIKYATDNGKCEEICKNCIKDFGKHLQGKYNPTTVNNYITAFNRFLKYINASDLRIKTLKLQNRNSLKNCLTKEEYKKILKIAKEQGDGTNYYLIRTLAATGIRVSELQYITVTAVKEGENTVINKGKVRDVIIPRAVCKELLEYCKQNDITDGYLFYTKRTPDRCISENAVWRRIKRIGELAKIDKKKMFPHNLRHFFSVVFMEETKNLAALADELGHTSIETTRIYARTTKAEKRKIKEKLRI